MWPGGSRRHPTEGKYSRSGWVSLTGRGVEKVRLSSRLIAGQLLDVFGTRCDWLVSRHGLKIRVRGGI